MGWPPWAASRYRGLVSWMRCAFLGYVDGERRWRSEDGKELMTWDGLHGEVEVYNRPGRHIGTKDPITGVWIKNAIRGRRIDA
jgi:hypothetical protein